LALPKTISLAAASSLCENLDSLQTFLELSFFENIFEKSFVHRLNRSEKIIKFPKKGSEVIAQTIDPSLSVVSYRDTPTNQCSQD